MTLAVEVVSPERVQFSGEARVVICRTTEGELAFLTDHAPLIGALGIGEVRIGQESGEEEVVAVHGGFVEVRNNKVTILSDVAELKAQIDVNRAKEAQSRAQAAVQADADDEEAKAALRRAEVRLEVASTD
ncbi:MAG: ATP synthase F1 subunit epsilon [Acidimicrobiales bacterium]